MTRLLERHGQWGSAVVGKDHGPRAYDNAYLVADPNEAWILETAGRDWAARRVSQRRHAISNELSIRTDPDLMSDGLPPPGSRRRLVPGRSNLRCRRRLHRSGHTAPGFAHPPATRRRTARGSCAPVADSTCLRRSGSCATTWRARSWVGRRSTRRGLISSPCACTSIPRGSPGEIQRPLSSSNCTPTRSVPVALWWCPVTPCTGVYVPYFVESGRLPDGAFSGRCPPPPRGIPAITVHAAFDPLSSWWRWQQLLDVAKDPATRDFTGRARRHPARIRSELERGWRP